MKLNFFLTVLCCVILSACTTKIVELQPVISSGIKVMPSTNDHVIELLKFCDTYSNLTPEAQKEAFTETNLILAENSNDLVHRIKLAAMLALPTSRLRDTVRAQALLQELLQENNLSATDSAFASLLYEYAVDNTKQIQKNRDDAKLFETTQQKLDTTQQRLDNTQQKLENTQQKLESIQQKVENTQQKIEALEQKINDLKNIEKNMIEQESKPSEIKTNANDTKAGSKP